MPHLMDRKLVRESRGATNEEMLHATVQLIVRFRGVVRGGRMPCSIPSIEARGQSVKRHGLRDLPATRSQCRVASEDAGHGLLDCTALAAPDEPRIIISTVRIPCIIGLVFSPHRVPKSGNLSRHADSAFPAVGRRLCLNRCRMIPRQYLGSGFRAGEEL